MRHLNFREGSATESQGALKGNDLRWQTRPNKQIFADGTADLRLFNPSKEFQHVRCVGNGRKAQILAEKRRFSQKTAGERRLSFIQQDTKEHLNQKGTWIGVFGSQQREKWWESEQGLKGKEGENWREKGWEERGSESTLEKVCFWYPYDLGTLFSGLPIHPRRSIPWSAA